MKNFHFSFFYIVVLLFQTSFGYSQNLTPSTLFSDNMVLQQGMDVPIWGEAAPNEKITVTFAGQSKSTTTNKEGKWMLKLKPLKANKKGQELIISDSTTEIKLSNVVVGEVWICSGQSNMQWPINKVPEIEALEPFANNLRSFEVKRTVSYTEENNAIGQWKPTHPSSAVAFGFAFFLENIGDVPVGIIHASWGSSSIEAWMPQDMADDLPYFKSLMDDFNADIETRKKIETIINKPNGWTRQDDIFLRRQPNILYNAMMKPLAPFACRGLVWYQGERNTRYLSGVPVVDENTWFHRVIGMKEYGDVLKLWINRYREEWNNNHMHFSIVMLPGYGKGTAKNPDIDPLNPTEESFAWMRESQLKALDLPYTSVANTIDLGDVKNIHPSDKYPIGQRLALLAAKHTINKNVIAEGPMLDKVEQHDNTLVVYFNHSTGLKTTNKKAPTGFWIADDSLNWKMANAQIQDETVILSHNEIKSPKYIRYAFSGKPLVNLVNAQGLPAYPFRTDN